MKYLRKKLLISSGIVLSSILAATMVNADTNTEELISKNSDTIIESASLQTSASARALIGYAREARIALFDGQTDLAKDLVKNAKDEFKKGLEKFAIKDKDLGYVVPIDSGLVFSEDFKPEDKHTAAINEAGVLMQNGDVAKAISIMTKSGVKLVLSAIVIPVDEFNNKLDEAIENIEEGEFYSANLTLKTIESAVEARSYDPESLPVQGYDVDEVF